MWTPKPIAALLASRAFTITAAITLTAPYWISGFEKLLNIPGALEEARHFSLQPAIAVVWATIIVQIAGSAMVITGRLAWLGAGALGVHTALATLIAHRFWQFIDPVMRFHERNSFVEHIGLIGGLMVAAILAERP